MTKIIGVTGGIGSGKTTVVRYFESLGIPVFIADVEAKKVMDLPEVISKIKILFGESIFDKGQLSRKQLAAIVFSNPEKLHQLNSIIHPIVKKHFTLWLDQHLSAPFVVYEAAILFESGSAKNCDYTLTVTAPLEDRIARVMQRDSVTRAQVLERINAQWTDAQRIAASDFVVENKVVAKTEQEIDRILKILRNYQKER